jgi:GT2 family glycosyltransferase
VCRAPAVVVNVDLARDLPAIDAGAGRTLAFVVIRFHGVPVGHAWVPLDDGRTAAESLAGHAWRAAMPALSRRWLERRLGPVLPPDPATLPSIGAAICTRERPDDLARALPAVVKAAAGRPVLVIDNRPVTDATRAIVARFPDVRYIREDRPGLNAARNRALAEAVTDVVAFCDDDAVPEPGWLDALRGGFSHRLVLGVTGLTLPLELDTDAQIWFERINPFGRGYFPREFDPLECSPQAAGIVGAGANMAVRRSVVDLVGPFDERLDAGTPTRSGGDHEIFARILGRGYRLRYEPAAVSWHRHRRTWADLRDTLYGYGVGVYAMWTGRLVSRGELAVLKQAGWWLARQQLPALVRTLRNAPGAVPRDLLFAELQGCLHGPWAWLRSSRSARTRPAA